MTRAVRAALRPPPGLAPGIDALRRRRWPALRGDLLGGLTVSAYLVPQVLAYAVVAGLPPVAGLWAAAAALVVYPLLGSSRLLSIGPESTTALLTAVAIAPLAAGDPGRYAALAAGLALVVGVVCVLARLARLAFLADLLSRPVLVGYLAGIAAIMIISQLEPLTGVSLEGDGAFEEVVSFATGLDQVHLPTLAVGLTVLALLGLGALVAPRAPVPLITVLLAAGAVAVFRLDERGVATIGAVPAGLPVPELPAITPTEYGSLLLPALGVAVVGYTDVVLTGRAFADRGGDRTATPLDADRELLALGGANLASGLVGAFPVSSSGSRTALGAATGARSQLHSVVALLAVGAVLLAGGRVLEVLPRAALGALVVYAALRLVDVHEFRRIAHFRRSELLLALATVAAVLALGVLYGVLVAIGLSLLDLVRRIARPHSAVLGFAPGIPGMHDVGDLPGTEQVPGLVVHRYDAPLFFANADDFRSSVLAATEDTASARWVLLDLEAVTELDVTAADMLCGLARELTGRGVVVAVARAKRELVEDLAAGGVLETIPRERLYPTLPTAVAAYRAATSGAARPPGSVPDGGPPAA
ncbi:SulP family inorganic anion transporter [Pseudonocardia halophobica]|uniref:Sodium-independent anion transporter n=1 Tax=Pseudonocardia halophobica TaxID=29401 RepID=A0A9W6L1W8_9PSEU|nr:SulP family inorganic anion transporter [Pseudonocardia halophobica]GLL09534.1 sodium-independent anion transporter [Pseudonocardia halophobica]